MPDGSVRPFPRCAPPLPADLPPRRSADTAAAHRGCHHVAAAIRYRNIETMTSPPLTPAPCIRL